MSKIHIHIPRTIFFSFLSLVGAFFSGNIYATTCPANESPSYSCSQLVLDNNDLNVTIPIGVTVGDAGLIFAAIDNTGDNNTITNNGTLDSFTAMENIGIANRGNNLSVFNNGIINSYANGIENIANSIEYISNFGSISSGDVGIYNRATIENINNASGGSVHGGNVGIYNAGVVRFINNYSNITSGGFAGLNNDGIIYNLNNTGSGLIIGDSAGIYNSSVGTITTLINSALITSSGSADLGGGTAIGNAGYIGQLTNNGQITSDNTAIDNSGTIDLFDNTSTIRSAASNAISNQGTIQSLNNSGTISSGSSSGYGIANNSGGTIQTLINTGTISGGLSGIYNWIGDDDHPAGTINMLNNLQGAGNSAGALTYTGNLPTNYNIIVNSPSSFGRLAGYSVSGFTNFGIYSGSVLSKGTYTSVLSGLTAGTNVNATSGMYSGTGWRLVETGVGTGIWDLIADYSATNTLVGLQSNANALSTVYNQQAAAYQAALSYDCQVYDAAGLCVSVGGRYTYAGPSPSSNQQAGLVIVGYKPVQTFRVGAFADQSVNISTPSGFSQSKSSPMWGLFAKWHMNKDETGLGIQASAVTSSSSLTATRPQLFNTEAGSGTTQFNGQGYQLTTNYHQPVTDSTSLVPYLGLRYTRINAGAYTENTTATVTSPLSYNAMAQNTFSAIGGIGVRSHLAEKLTGTASVGIQQNLNYSMGNYAGTSSIMGLETFSVQMPGNVNSMATATAGMFYDINKRERVGVNVLWQQQPFIATNTTTALATYTIGF